MATTRAALIARLEALAQAKPFSYTLVDVKFDFRTVPNGVLDGALRIEAEQQKTEAYLGPFEAVTDNVTVWIARLTKTVPRSVYRALHAELQTLRTAILWDGAQGGGDFVVVDGGSARVDSVPRADVMVGRLVLPINYEVEL